jgi:hypothetical protein
MGHKPGFARVVHGTLAMLRFLGVVHGTTTALTLCRLGRITMPILTHLSKAHFPQHPELVSKPFHTGHVVAPVVPGCLLLRFGP